MKDELTYDKAYKKLESIVNQIQSDKVQVDTLAEKIKEAKILIVFCEKKLRNIEFTIEDIQKMGSKRK